MVDVEQQKIRLEKQVGVSTYDKLTKLFKVAFQVNAKEVFVVYTKYFS